MQSQQLMGPEICGNDVGNRPYNENSKNTIIINNRKLDIILKLSLKLPKDRDPNSKFCVQSEENVYVHSN